MKVKDESGNTKYKPVYGMPSKEYNEGHRRQLEKKKQKKRAYLYAENLNNPNITTKTEAAILAGYSQTQARSTYGIEKRQAFIQARDEISARNNGMMADMQKLLMKKLKEEEADGKIDSKSIQSVMDTIVRVNNSYGFKEKSQSENPIWTI